MAGSIKKIVEILQNSDPEELEEVSEGDGSEEGDEEEIEIDAESQELVIVKFSANLDPPCDAFPHQMDEKLLHRYRNFFIRMRMFNHAPVLKDERQEHKLEKEMSTIIDNWRMVTRTLALRGCAKFEGGRVHRKYHMIKTTGVRAIDEYISEYISNYVRSKPDAVTPGDGEIERELEYIVMETGVDWSDEIFRAKKKLITNDMEAQYIDRRSDGMDELVEFLGGGAQAIKAAEARYSEEASDLEGDG